MLFNWEFYINKYEDLKKSNIKTEIDALNHWKTYGKYEKRIYNDISIFFYWKDYLELNDDLQNNILNEDDAWRHFLYYGNIENRSVYNYLFLIDYCV